MAPPSVRPANVASFAPLEMLEGRILMDATWNTTAALLFNTTGSAALPMGSAVALVADTDGDMDFGDFTQATGAYKADDGDTLVGVLGSDDVNGAGSFQNAFMLAGDMGLAPFANARLLLVWWNVDLATHPTGPGGGVAFGTYRDDTFVISGNGTFSLNFFTESAVPGSNPDSAGRTDDGVTTGGMANTPPIANNDAFSVNEDTQLIISAPGVLMNDTDGEANPLTAQIGANPANGLLTLNANGSFTYTPNANFNGTDTFTYRANDGMAVSATAATVTITVNAVNDAPVAVANSYSTVQNTPLNVTTVTGVLVNDTDLEGNALTATLVSNVSNGTLTLNANGSFDYTPAAGFTGMDSFTYKANDGGADSNTVTVTIDVTAPTNQAPVLAAIGDKSVDELANLTFTAMATDADVPAQMLTFSLDATAIAAGMTIDPATGQFNWTPTEQQGPGSFMATIAVTDNGAGNLTDTETITITVNEVNVAPVLAAIGDKSVDELSNLTFTAMATDADLAAQTLTFSLDATAVAAGMTIDPTTGIFNWTPTEAQGPGNFPVTITVTDNGTGNLTDTESITITVNEVADANVAPVLAAIGDKSVSELASLAFTAMATDADVPAQTLTFSLDAASVAAGMAIAPSTGAFSWTPTEAQNGPFNVTVTVTDNGTGNLSDSETIVVTVNEVNVAPVLAAIGDRSVNELSNLAFTAIATDADLPANTLTFSLDAAAIAAGMTINPNTGAFSWTPTEAQGPGNFNATITVTDNGTGSLSDSEMITITVNEVADANVAPVLAAIGDKSVNELSDLTFTAMATDADVPVQTLTFSLDAAALAAGMTINAATGVFNWTPTEAQGPGNFNVTITVTDSGAGNLTDTETITITVSEVADVNQAPVLAAIGDKSVDELSNLTFTAMATDADVPAQTLTFSLDAASIAAGMTINAATGLFNWTPTEAQGPGNFPVTITVTDSGTGNLADLETITITVNEVPDTPDVVNADAKGNVIYTDAQGNIVTVNLKGMGTLQVLRPTGTGATLTTPADAIGIVVTGSDAKSALSVKVKADKNVPASTGITRVDTITVGGPIGTIDAKTTDLEGDLTTGPAKTIKLRNVMDDHTITISNTGAAAKDTVTLEFGVIEDLQLTSMLPIKSLKAISWTDTNPATVGDEVRAPSLGSLTITGDKKTSNLGAFEADLILGVDSTDPNAKATLGNVKVAGPVEHVTTNIIGDVSGFSFASSVKDSIFVVASNVNKFDAKGALTDVAFNIDQFGTISAASWLRGSLAATFGTTIQTKGDKKVNDLGDVTDVMMMFEGVPAGSKAKDTVGSIKLAGSAAGQTSILVAAQPNNAAAANIGSIAVAAWQAGGIEIAGGIKTFSSKAGFQGLLGAASIGTFDVKTNLVDATIIAGGMLAGVNSIGTFKVGGAMTNSQVRVGVDIGADGRFNTADDALKAAASANLLKAVTVGLEATPLDQQLFFAGAFPKTASINKIKVDPLTDLRFGGNP